jgi:hypothetical protein
MPNGLQNKRMAISLGPNQAQVTVYTHGYSGASHCLLRMSIQVVESAVNAFNELRVTDALKAQPRDDMVSIAMKTAMAPETCPGCSTPHMVCKLIMHRL